MKKLLIFSLLIVLIFCSGCSVAENPSASRTSNENLKINEVGNMQNGVYSIYASIDHITVDPSRPSSHQINTFITVKNTGNTAVTPIWFCKLTDYAGVSNGGFGIGGSLGAGGELLYPGESQTSADHIFIYSDKQYSALLKGAIMECTFSHKESLTSPMLNIGTSSWNVDFNNI